MRFDTVNTARLHALTILFDAPANHCRAHIGTPKPFFDFTSNESVCLS